MATTKKPKNSKKKTSKKKASKKKTSKRKSSASKAKATEDMTAEERIQLQVQGAAAELIKDIQDGKILGMTILTIGRNADSDTIRISGESPPQRISYLLDLAGHFNITAAVQNLRNANEKAQAAKG